MKKALLGIIALASLNVMAVELQLKGGYDVFRFQSKEKTFYEKENRMEEGFVVNAELFPLNQLRVEPGLGVEYNFSNKTPGFGVKIENENEKNKSTKYHFVPVYGIVKANIVQLENGDSPLSAVAKLGYTFVQDEKSDYKPGAGGIYYGLGVNGEYGPFVVEFMVSRTSLLNMVKKESQPASSAATIAVSEGPDNAPQFTNITDKGDITKLGLTLGLRIGKLHKDVAPLEAKPMEVVAPVVEQTMPEPMPVVEEPAPAPMPEPMPVVEEPTPAPMPEPMPVVEEPAPAPMPEPEPVKKIAPTLKQVELQAEALFKFDKSDVANILEEGKKEIVALVELLNDEYARIDEVQVVGHTDRFGSAKYNMALGQRRANTVKALLQELGLKAEIKAISKGESEPKVNYPGKKATKKLKEALQPNRRVEINIVGQKYVIEEQ